MTRYFVRCKQSLDLVIPVALITLSIGGYFLVQSHAAPTTGLDEAQETKMAGNTVGPLRPYEKNCQGCHELEVEAWQHTRHFATFVDRHRSPEAKVIMKNMKAGRSMKRASSCRQCHYTSRLESGKITATWGVSCESCHGPAKDWVGKHHHAAFDDEIKPAMKWGDGKSEKPAARAARLGPAAAKDMIHSDMIYDIATNCFGCHTVPNETLVNKGKHKAGSAFDLVAWSQGEIRHNFVSSAGAPKTPTNRALSAKQKRRYYIVGAVVDYEVTLRNLSNVKEKDGDFHKAMIARANRLRKKVDAILKAAKLPALDAAIKAVPATIDGTTTITAELANKVGKAGRAFTKENDGSGLDGIDALVPTEYKGKVYVEKVDKKE
jgi:hypothetical protein